MATMTKAQKDEAKEALKQARALLSKPYGWDKGRYKRAQVKNGKTVLTFCLVGAVEYVTPAYLLFSEADVAAFRKAMNLRRVALNALRKCLPKTFNVPYGYRKDIIPFNDAPETKKKDVLAVVDCAIKEFE